MNRSLLYLSVVSLAISSCGNFLDTVPDDRIELDSKDKVTKMLVSAYPTVSTMLISELSSDNATDNGAQYDTYGQVCGRLPMERHHHGRHRRSEKRLGRTLQRHSGRQPGT